MVRRPREETEEPRERYRSRSSNSGLPGPVIGFGVLIVLVAALGFIYTQLGPEAEADAAGETRETVDPFADVPEEAPPPKRSGGERSDPTTDPFTSVSDLTDAQVWKDGVALADDGFKLIKRAVKAREDGKRAEAKRLGAEAQQKLDAAVQSTRKYEKDMTAQHGERSMGVREISRIRQRWTREIMALKKTAGL